MQSHKKSKQVEGGGYIRFLVTPWNRISFSMHKRAHEYEAYYLMGSLSYQFNEGIIDYSTIVN